MTLIELREMCANIADDEWDLYDNLYAKKACDSIAKVIRAIQLPVDQEPIGYFKGDENGDLVWDEDCVSSEPVYDFDYGDGFKDVSIPIYRTPPSVAALEKQVAELKQKLSKAENLQMVAVSLDKSNIQKENAALEKQVKELKESLRHMINANDPWRSDMVMMRKIRGQVK